MDSASKLTSYIILSYSFELSTAVQVNLFSYASFAAQATAVIHSVTIMYLAVLKIKYVQIFTYIIL